MDSWRKYASRKPGPYRSGGTARDDSNRVIRGGSWKDNDASNLLSSHRNNDGPTDCRRYRRGAAERTRGT